MSHIMISTHRGISYSVFLVPHV